MRVALAALEAKIVVRGLKGEREIPIQNFQRLPGSSPERDTNLEPEELILWIDLPPSRYASHSQYLKIRDRASYDFALVSVAAALDLEGSRIRSARIAVGGVAHKPWRSTEAEEILKGQKPEPAVFETAANQALDGAKTYRYNGFNVEMTKRAIVRALDLAGGQA